MESAEVNPREAAASFRPAKDGGAKSSADTRSHSQELSIEESWRQAAELAEELIVSQAHEHALRGRVTFEVDPRTQRIIVRLVDPETEEVLREIPPEEMRQISQMANDLRGHYLNRTA